MLVYNEPIGNLEVGRLIDTGTVDTVGTIDTVDTVGAVDVTTGESTDVMKKIEVDVITVTDKDAGRDFVPEQYSSPCTKGCQISRNIRIEIIGSEAY